MKNSRVSRATAALSSTTLVLMLTLGTITIDGYWNGLWAQSEAPAPRRLLPRNLPSSSAEPQESPKPFPEVQPGIEVNRLQGPDPQDFGMIDALSGGLTRNMWDGTSASMVAHLIRQLPDAIKSRTLREALRRLLLTAATPPIVDQQSVNLGALRIGQLQAMGLLGSATALLDAAPHKDTDIELRRLHANTLLMRNDIVGACTETRRPGTNLAAPFWQHLLIFCHAAENNLAEASFGASLLAEGNEPIDPVFMLLIDGFVSGEVRKVDAIDHPTPLLLAMLRHAKLPMPAAALDLASPPLLMMIATSPETDLDLRLAAAEKAVLFGAMTTDRLISIYLDAPFSGDDLDTALSTAKAARSPRGRALLYQAATGHSVPTARAEVLHKALVFAEEDGFYPQSIRVYQSMLESMVPSVELSWFAADAARALLALGRSELAESWVNELRYQSVRDPMAKQALGSLWAMAKLAGAPNESFLTTASFEDWRAAISANSPSPANARMKDGVALLEIFGYPIEAAQWEATLTGLEAVKVWLPDYSYRAAMRRAAAAGRLAETVLLAVIVVGGDGLGELDASVLADIVEALRTVGLTAESQALIFEAAIGKRI